MAKIEFPLPAVTWRSNLFMIWMVARKDWVNFWRYPLNAISSIFMPLVWLTPVYFMGQAFSINGKAMGFAAYSGTSDYVSFVLIGMVLNNYIQTVFWNMGFSLKGDMDSGVLESNWLSPASRPLMLIARTFTNLAFTTVISLAMLLAGAVVFGFRPTGNAFAAVLTVLPLLIGLYGFGIAFAAIVLLMRDANSMVDMTSYLVSVFSGSQFPVQALPRWLMPVSLILPLTYGFDAARGWLLKTRTVLPIEWEIFLMVVFMVLMVWFGLILFNKNDRKVRQLGTIGQH